MACLDLRKHPHRRFNALTAEWILVSPQRAERPWLGQIDKPLDAAPPSYDPTCYMCPGNTRATGHLNPRYRKVFVFDNDYPALLPDTPQAGQNEEDLIVAGSESGICRVVCFSPRHDLTISRMDVTDLRPLVDVWAEEWQTLGKLPFVNYVQIFENRGAMMGASNPHPHGQIWASSSIPNELVKEQHAQMEYHKSHNSCLLCDYVRIECDRKERIICSNSHFVVLVPFWAIWPFETMLLSSRHISDMAQLSGNERDALADILRRLTSRYDNLFQISFPYSMGFHQSPTDGLTHPEWHFHAHFYPPLLRSASVRKFMVGYEMLATPQRDITPEAAAEQLRQASERW